MKLIIAPIGLIIALILSLQAAALGFEGVIPDDPVRCGGVRTFADSAPILREVHVSTTGSDSGNGSIKNPYATLQKAAAGALPGDHIIMHPGTYPGGIGIEGLSGTPDYPIVIKGPLQGEAVISGGGAGIHLVRPNYVILQGLTITGALSNGVNCDDGGNYTSPASHLILKDLKISSIGSGGKNNCIKLAGIDDFYIFNNTLSDSEGGLGIDMVGCHNGVIFNNTLRNLGSYFVQVKGGSSNVTVHGNYFNGVGYRGVNMGGSTGAQYFRPPIAMGTNYEARHIRVTSNVFIDVNSAAAFVGCDRCLFANNLVYKPRTWVLRILQETTSLEGVEFIKSRNGEFVNNIIIFNSSLACIANIGAGTLPETFRFAHNLWFSDNPDYGFNLPTEEINPLRQVNPLFEDEDNQIFKLRPGSPAIGAAEPGWVEADRELNCLKSNLGPYGSQASCTVDLYQAILKWREGQIGMAVLMETISRWKHDC